MGHTDGALVTLCDYIGPPRPLNMSAGIMTSGLSTYNSRSSNQPIIFFDLSLSHVPFHSVGQCNTSSVHTHVENFGPLKFPRSKKRIKW